jgi:hypothetical protein
VERSAGEGERLLRRGVARGRGRLSDSVAKMINRVVASVTSTRRYRKEDIGKKGIRIV